MEKLSEAAKVEDIENAKGELIEFDNFKLEQFMSNQDIGRFLETEFNAVVRNRVYQFTIKIFKSAAMEAYQKSRQEMIDARQVEIDAFDKEHTVEIEAGADPELIQGRPEQVKGNDPVMTDLLLTKTDLVIKKLRLKFGDLPTSWNTNDMLKYDWFVEFTE